MIIYKITNNINGKIYIGQTIKSLEHRWRAHKFDSNDIKTKRPICLALRKYGFDNFTIIEIDIARTIQELNSKEQYWIKVYSSTSPKNGYNADSGGTNAIPNVETRKKMSLAKKGKPSVKKDFSCSPETAKKISEANKGKEAWNKGLPQSEDQKQAHSQRMKGRIAHNKGVYQIVPVIRIDLTTNEEVVFNNKQEAADSIGVAKTRINQVLNGKNTIVKKQFTFKYK